jgi:hypothetical protein
MARALLAIGLNTREPILRYKIIAGLRTLIRPGDGWEEPSFPPDLIERLGEAALEDSEYGDAAAELIGHLRGPSAVNVILNSNREGRKIDALLLVQRVAGSLPAFVPRGVRLRLSLDWMLQRLTQQPVRLLGAYVLAFLGAALSIFLQNYVTIRLPNYFDITRLTTSLERGLITGSLCGLGIFFARLIVERFPMSSPPLRIFLGTTVGGTILSIALTVFHILFVRTFPSGLLITLGCLMIAFGFTLGGFLRSLPARIVLAVGAVFVAILGTWLIHFNLASSPLELTPLFKYEYSWSIAQVVVTVLAVSIPMGVLGSLLRLELKDEYL